MLLENTLFINNFTHISAESGKIAFAEQLLAERRLKMPFRYTVPKIKVKLVTPLNRNLPWNNKMRRRVALRKYLI